MIPMRLETDTKLALGLTMVLIVLAACNQQQAPSGEGEEALKAQEPEQALAASGEEKIQRGEYLVRFGSCNDCHTPWIFDEELGVPRPDMRRMLSGHPEGAPDPAGTVGPTDMALIGPTLTSFAMPIGTVYSQNLTPDMDTGIGSWTEEMFLDIFRKGRHLGGDGRGVLPPMPWFWIRNLSDDDLRAVYAYLNSIPPIKNAVPEPKIPEELIWQLRDGFDRFAAELPQAEWAAKKE
jgi:mono/diheme cytochrome c family protein